MSDTEIHFGERLSIQELETLLQTALNVTSELDLTHLLPKIIRCSRDLSGADAGGIYLFNEAEQRLEIAFQIGDDASIFVQLGEGLVGMVAQKGEEIIVNNYSQWEDRFIGRGSFPIQAMIGVPLMTADRTLGVLYLIKYDEGKHFDNKDAKVLTVLASQAAVALANAAQFNQHSSRLFDLTMRLNERLNHTVVNLTENEQTALRDIALRTGKTEGELIHDAVDKVIKQGPGSGNSGMLQARGIWRDRDDLPDFGELRREWNRF